jgi:hypothetical protein
VQASPALSPDTLLLLGRDTVRVTVTETPPATLRSLAAAVRRLAAVAARAVVAQARARPRASTYGGDEYPKGRAYSEGEYNRGRYGGHPL